MGLTMDQQKGVAREKAKRYRRASRKKKGRLIEDYMELTGCTRHHAAWLLRCWGTTVWDRRAGRPVKIVVGQRRSRQRTPRVYDQQTVAALTKLWRHFGYLCGKRLAATLRLWLPHYERWNARSQRKIALSPEVRAKLLRISPATIDRLLRAEKRKLTLRGRSHTKKPSGSLMLQIPIRTFSEWQNVPVGTLGVDLVGHDGGSAQGEFAYTLLATDRGTQWTELRAVPNKAQKWVFEQLLVVLRLPLPEALVFLVPTTMWRCIRIADPGSLCLPIHHRRRQLLLPRSVRSPRPCRGSPSRPLRTTTLWTARGAVAGAPPQVLRSLP